MSMRWAVPTGIGAAVVGLTLVVPAVAASAGTDLPDRTAEQLLTDLQGAQISAVQGTVVLDADLGLPSLPAIGGSGGPGDSGLDAMSVLAGTTTARVWASPDGLRVAALGAMGERDLVTDGTDLWLWSSDDNSATHVALPDLPEGAGHPGTALGEAAADPRAALAQLTPQELSATVLDALDPSTEVSTGPTTRVAGRPAYQLVLTPRTAGTLVGSVTIAIDAAERVPTRLTVVSTATDSPALTVGFTSVSFAAPDPSVFAFTPPPGATVEEADPMSADAVQDGSGQADGSAQAPGDGTAAGHSDLTPAGKPDVVGSGWSTVLVLPAAPGGTGGLDALGQQLTGQGAGPGAGGDTADTLSALLVAMPEISGDWGSGRLLSTHLFSVLVTDDGRTLVGAVDRATLEAAASATR